MQSKLQKNIGIILGIVVVCGVIFVTIFFGRQSGDTTTTPITATTTPGTTTPPTTTKNPTTTTTPPVTSTTPNYTLAQVQTHNNSSSCWSAIGNNVYDLTSWINQHPGGKQAILSLCGKDGTAAFEGQHGGQRRPENELASLKIGTYAK